MDPGGYLQLGDDYDYPQGCLVAFEVDAGIAFAVVAGDAFASPFAFAFVVASVVAFDAAFGAAPANLLGKESCDSAKKHLAECRFVFEAQIRMQLQVRMTRMVEGISLAVAVILMLIMVV